MADKKEVVDDLEVKPEDLLTDSEEEAMSAESESDEEEEESEDGKSYELQGAGDVSETIAEEPEGVDATDGRNDDDEDDDEEMETGEEQRVQRRTYIPSATLKPRNGSNAESSAQKDGDDEGEEELAYDKSAYHLFHKMNTGNPCLSFDIIKDSLGSGQQRAASFPLTTYFVGGTQAPQGARNHLHVVKSTNLHKIKQKQKDDDDESSSDSDSEDDENKGGKGGPHAPAFHISSIPVRAPVNRVRTTTIQGRTICGAWTEDGQVTLWDLSRHLIALDDPATLRNFSGKQRDSPLYTFKGHRTEGFAIDWSAVATGQLATGDCNKDIHIWKPSQSSWQVDQRPLIGHKASVEDLQWSPNEENMLASCSVDRSIRVWDIRAKPQQANIITAAAAHSADINVISWNGNDQQFILSGGDDGAIKVWDLRMLAGGRGATPDKPAEPIGVWKHHTGQITSVEWHPTDSTVFAAAGEDDQVTQWDLAVEHDDDQEEDEDDLSDTEEKEPKKGISDDERRLKQLPPQLLFIHQGQREVKEVHWHPQIPGLLMSTASSGMDLFRTISV